MKWKMGFSIIPTQILMDERLSRSCLIVFWVLTVHIFRGKKILLPLDSDDSQRSALVPSNGDTGDQRA